MNTVLVKRFFCGVDQTCQRKASITATPPAGFPSHCFSLEQPELFEQPPQMFAAAAGRRLDV